MNLRRTFLSTVFAASLALTGTSALAQESTPETEAEASPVTYLTVNPKAIKTVDGTFAGTISLWEDEEGVHMVVRGAGGEIIPVGEHGIHIHETGVCDADADPAFDTAGGHFNPTDEEHGDVDADPSHGGDLGNFTVAEDGSWEHWASVSKITLNPGEENSLNDADGSAIVIHADADDLSTDPSGESGDRIACGVIFEPTEDTSATPVATPEDEEATPAS